MAMHLHKVTNKLLVIRFSGWVDDAQVMHAIEEWHQHHADTPCVILYMVDMMIPNDWGCTEYVGLGLRSRLASPDLRRIIAIVPSEHPLRVRMAIAHVDFHNKLFFADSALEALGLAQIAIDTW